MTSVDIGVSENGADLLGRSLQLGGTGQFYEDFTWNAAAVATFGAVNAGQIFGAGDVAPTVVNAAPANGAINVTVDANIYITFREHINETSSAFSSLCEHEAHIVRAQSC